MPLYDFHCHACGKDTELLVRADASPSCPSCGSAELTRMISRISPPGKSREIIASARRQARREGHFSNY